MRSILMAQAYILINCEIGSEEKVIENDVNIEEKDVYI